MADGYTASKLCFERPIRHTDGVVVEKLCQAVDDAHAIVLTLKFYDLDSMLGGDAADDLAALTDGSTFAALGTLDCGVLATRAAADNQQFQGLHAFPFRDPCHRVVGWSDRVLSPEQRPYAIRATTCSGSSRPILN